MTERLRRGDRFGICLPVLCEYRSGILLSRRYRQNLRFLQTVLARFRLWPADEATAAEFADILGELRLAGKALAQFDHLIAAIARQRNLTLLTSDRDFDVVAGLRIENWL